jgi:hypothetical protein
MTASLEAPRLLDLATDTSIGVRESPSESSATSHSGDGAAFEEARAART